MNTQTEKQLTPAQQKQKEQTQAAIAQRAYEKWAKRGYQHGHDQCDWIEAEKEIKDEKE
jgi:hypothetical protein